MGGPLAVPYFRQTDNEGGQGWRDSASSSAAIVAAFMGKVKTDDEFNRTRRRFGESTDVSAQARALAALGLEPLFRTDGDWGVIEHWISKGRRVILPYLHNAHVSEPRGGGHWVVCIGIARDVLTIHDPMGEPDLIFGGHILGRSGKAVLCSRRNFGRRWMVEGPGSGWYLTVL